MGGPPELVVYDLPGFVELFSYYENNQWLPDNDSVRGFGCRSGGHKPSMLTILLIIVVLFLLFGGGGYFYRGRRRGL